MSANMLFFAARSRSPIKFFALRAGSPPRRRRRAHPRPSRAWARRQPPPPPSRRTTSSPSCAGARARGSRRVGRVRVGSRVGRLDLGVRLRVPLLKLLLLGQGLGLGRVRGMRGRARARARLRVGNVGLLRGRERRGGGLAGGEGGADGGAREEHQSEHHERQEPRREDHRRGGELVLLAFLAVERPGSKTRRRWRILVSHPSREAKREGEAWASSARRRSEKSRAAATRAIGAAERRRARATPPTEARSGWVLKSATTARPRKTARASNDRVRGARGERAAGPREAHLLLAGGVVSRHGCGCELRRVRRVAWSSPRARENPDLSTTE